jgi:hypothetical protein
MKQCDCVYSVRCFPLLNWCVRHGLYTCRQNRKHAVIPVKSIKEVVEKREYQGNKEEQNETHKS